MDSRSSSELNMTEQYKAYVAGFFDGEGCVSAQAYYQKGKYEIYPRITMQLNITQTSKEVLEYIQKEFGGRVGQHSRKNPRHKDCYRLVITGKKNMEYFILSVIDYSIVKKDELSLGLDFVKTLRDSNLGCLSLPEHVHILRRNIYNKLVHRKSTVPTRSDSRKQTPNMLETPERAISRHRSVKAGKAPETTKEHLHEMVV